MNLDKILSNKKISYFFFILCVCGMLLGIYINTLFFVLYGVDALIFLYVLIPEGEKDGFENLGV